MLLVLDLLFWKGINGREGGFWLGVCEILVVFGGGVFYGIMIRCMGLLLIDLIVDMVIFIVLIGIDLLDFVIIDNEFCGVMRELLI